MLNKEIQLRAVLFDVTNEKHDYLITDPDNVTTISGA